MARAVGPDLADVSGLAAGTERQGDAQGARVAKPSRGARATRGGEGREGLATSPTRPQSPPGAPGLPGARVRGQGAGSATGYRRGWVPIASPFLPQEGALVMPKLSRFPPLMMQVNSLPSALLRLA